MLNCAPCAAGVYEYYSDNDKRKKVEVIDGACVRDIREAINLGPIDEVEVRMITDPDNPVVVAQNELFPSKTAEFGGTFGLFVREVRVTSRHGAHAYTPRIGAHAYTRVMAHTLTHLGFAKRHAHVRNWSARR